MADIRSFFAKIPAKKASDDEQQIFTPIPNQLEPGSNRILTTTNSRTKTSRDSEDGQRKRKANTLKIATSNVKTTGEDEVGGSTLKSSLVPKQLGPDELCATVITVDNGPNAEVYTIEFGSELIKLLVLKEEDFKRGKNSKLWSFLELMNNKNDGSYLCVHLQSAPAIAFLTNPLRAPHRQQFPKLSNTIKVYNDELAPLCISSKMNIMATSKSATSFHNDRTRDKEDVITKQDRLIHCINIGKKIAFRMTHGKSEHSIVCSTNTQHHIVSGKHCTYCDPYIAKHKGSNTESGIVLTLVADPQPGVDSSAVPHALINAIKTLAASTTPPTVEMNSLALDLHKEISRCVAITGNNNARGRTISEAMMGDANFNHNPTWSFGDRFDAALIAISLHPNKSRRKFLTETKLAPSSESKYVQQLHEMLRKIKEKGIDFMEPTSDAAKAAHKNITPSIVRLYFEPFGGRLICRFEGCTTPSQGSCGGMCYKHRKNKK